MNLLNYLKDHALQISWITNRIKVIGKEIKENNFQNNSKKDQQGL
jgi:hypothetical protein